MKNIILFLTAIVILSSSCQKHLDRDDALKQIADHNGKTYYPQKYTYEITKMYIKDVNTEGAGVTAIIGEDEFKSKEKNIEQFKALGLLTLKETPHREETTQFLLGTTVRTWKSVDVSLTTEGKRYLDTEKSNSYLVKLWDIEIKEISGIKEMKEFKSAQVDYVIWNNNITPFGSIFNDKYMTQNRSVTFSLYDDGWRIQQ